MNSSAEALGRLIGIGISILLPLVLIILNSISIRRRRTNGFCAMAIICTLLAIIVLSLSGQGSRTTHVPIHVLQWLTISGVGLMLVSTILAVIGLLRFYWRRRFTRGRWRAVIALGLNALYLTFIIMNSIDGVNDALAWYKVLQPTSAAGALAISESWNFRVLPPPSWTQIDPTAFGSDTRIAFSRKGPEMYALISAQDFPDGVDAPLSDVMDALKKTLRANGRVEFLTEEEKMDHEFLARTLEMRSHELIRTNFHVFWMIRDGSTHYRITVWGEDGHADQVRVEARKMFEGFQLIDPRRVPTQKAKPKVVVRPARQTAA